MKDNLHIMPFKKNHALTLTSGLMNDPLLAVDEKWKAKFENLEEPGMSFTAADGDELIVAGGVCHLWDGVYEGWVIACDKVWNYRVGAARAIKKNLDQMIEKNSITRVQTAVKKDFLLGQRFASWLGFENEGIMKKYVLNQDHIRFARVL